MEVGGGAIQKKVITVGEGGGRGGVEESIVVYKPHVTVYFIIER